MPEHDSDYDGAWKEALRDHFPQFIEKYFPAMRAAIDWSAPLGWLDKEVSQVLGQPHRRNRAVDVLVKVRLCSGVEQWILVHLEIQTSYEEGFELRLELYNSGLFWVFGQRVVTLVVLADLREDWLPCEDIFQVAEFESRLRFSVCKLIARLEADWRGDTSLPVQLARAQIEALRTAGDPEGRFRAKEAFPLSHSRERLVARALDSAIRCRESLRCWRAIRLRSCWFPGSHGSSRLRSKPHLARARFFRQGRTRRIYRKLLTHFLRVRSRARASPDRNPVSRTP